MIRVIAIASAFLLATSSIVHAEDSEAPLLNLGLKQQHLHRVDMSMSPREYEELSSRNRRFAHNSLRSYSINALELLGISERGIHLTGAVVGLATRGARLNLNKSKTLTLEFKDVGDSERALMYFGVNLDW
jgi:UV DNA damage repair endonuclease